MIRVAEPRDAEDCALLLFMAGPNLFKYLLPVEERKIHDMIALLMTKPDNAFSCEHIRVDEDNGRLRGVTVFFPARARLKLEQNIARYRRDLVRIGGLFGMIRGGLRSTIQRYTNVLGDDELYIENLAVAPECRRMGVATSLLQYAFDACREQGLSKVSLLVELENESAQQLYRRTGFDTCLTIELPRKYHKHRIPGFLKLTRSV